MPPASPSGAARLPRRDRETMHALLSRAGVNRPGAGFVVQEVLAAPRPGALDLRLRAPRVDVRVRIRNRLPEDAAGTASFAVELVDRDALPDPAPADRIVRALREMLDRADPGGLSLGGPRALLPVIDDEGAPTAPGISWDRAVFDPAFERLLADGGRAATVVIVVTQACEMSCVFCPTVDRVHIHRREDDPAEQLADLVHQLSAGRRLGARTVDFGGNDVLRFPRALDLFEAAGRAGFETIIAQSPGQALADMAFARAVAATPLSHAAVPIYGTTAAEHDVIVGREGAFDRLCQALDNVRSLGRPQVVLHTIALRRNVHRMEDIFRFCDARFGLPVRVMPLQPNRLGQSEHLSDTVPFRELREAAARRPESFNTFPLCVLPPAFALRNEGRIPPRSINLFDVGLPADSEDQAARRARQHVHPEACGPCRLLSVCSGITQAHVDRFGADDLRPLS